MWGGSFVNMSDEEYKKAVQEITALVEKRCTEHERTAAAYRKAIWQPWLRLTIKEPKECAE